MFESLAKKTAKAKGHFSYLNMYDEDPLVKLASIASEPDDFLLAGDSALTVVKNMYSKLRNNEGVGTKLNPVFAGAFSVLSLFPYFKIMSDQRYLRELATIEIARRQRVLLLLDKSSGL